MAWTPDRKKQARRVSLVKPGGLPCPLYGPGFRLGSGKGRWQPLARSSRILYIPRHDPPTIPGKGSQHSASDQRCSRIDVGVDRSSHASFFARSVDCCDNLRWGLLLIVCEVLFACLTSQFLSSTGVTVQCGRPRERGCVFVRACRGRGASFFGAFWRISSP